MPIAMVNFREGEGEGSLHPSYVPAIVLAANSIKSPWGDMKASSRFYEARTMGARGLAGRKHAASARFPRTVQCPLLYNDSFRCLVTRVRRINWSCYSVAARRDPNRARSRVQPSRLPANGVVAKASQAVNEANRRLRDGDVVNIVPLYAISRRR